MVTANENSAEVAAAGVAAIFVPFPQAVDDHQTANARYLVERNAAVLLPQSELTPGRFVELLKQFAENRDIVRRMAEAGRACSIPNADDAVAQLCLEAMHA